MIYSAQCCIIDIRISNKVEIMAIDKRIIKTQKAIKEAFMLLTMDKEIEKITVSDIAEKAFINRSTFYLHYSDARDVMQDIEREMGDNIYTCIENFDTDKPYESTYYLLLSLTNAIDKDKTFKNFFLHSKCSKYLTSKIKKIFVEKGMESALNRKNLDDTTDLKLALTYITSGIIDTYVRWADSENCAVSLDGLCRKISVLTERTIQKLKELY